MVRGSHARAWHGVLALCVSLFTWSIDAGATELEEGRVRVECPLNGDALVEESVTRTVGELSALGLEVEVLHRSSAALVQRQLPALESGMHGLIALYRLDGRVHVDTWAPNGGRALQLDFDPMERGMNAEVIAIRAVESLRTRWLEYEHEGAAALPERVAEIAHATPNAVEKPAPDEPEPSAETATSPPPDTAPLLVAPESAATPRQEPRIVGTVEVGLAVEAAGTSHTIAGAGAGVRLGRWVLGLGFDTSITAFTLTDALGSVDGSRTRVLLEVSAEFPLTHALSAVVAAKAGAARYWLDASVSVPGYVERDRASLDVTAAGELGLRYWLHEHLALQLAAEVNTLRQGLAVDVAGQELGRVGLPGVALHAGLGLGLL